jgi:cell division inhibitor SulA/protein ImuA
MLVAPPHIPYAPAFEAHGFDLSRLLVVRTGRHMDVLWAMEQALRSGTCAAVMAWSAVSDDRALRRLQLAAEQGRCWAVLFRPPGMREAASPAALRVRLSRADDGQGLTLHILRQRHGPAAAVRVDV